jgi:hypothetical protein
MVVDNDTIGVVRAHRWITVVEQRRRLEEAGYRTVVELSDRGYGTDDLLKLANGGRTFVAVHAFLLADPTKRHQLGGMARDLDTTLGKITKAGCVVLDLSTGLSTRDARRDVVKTARAHIIRSNRGQSSALNGLRSHGRPRAWTKAEVRKIIWEAWHSREYPTNEEAAKAVSKLLGRKVSKQIMYRTVQRMREEQGDENAGGASGRLPGNPNFKVKRARRQSHQKRKRK